MSEIITQDTVREWALISDNNEILYIKNFALSDPESYLGNYEGVNHAIATSRFDYPVQVGMKWNSLTMKFE